MPGAKPPAAKVSRCRPNRVLDNDWIEAFNRNGVAVARAFVTHKMPDGTVYMYQAQERVVDVSMAEASGRRGGPAARRRRPSDQTRGGAVMGWVYGLEGSYAIGLMMLSYVATRPPST